MSDRVGQQLGNYQLTRLLGEGGFAEVYLGEHIHLGTQAAIKVLNAQLTSDDIDKFRTEARTVARLIHPHIVRVLEFGVEGKTPFLVMDYAPNGTLRQHHPRGVPLPLDTVVSYVKQIADALQYAHDEKLIHRDIKPENMLLGRRNEVLLSDFGIAIVAQSSRYQNAQDMAGTISYMAPEQIQAHPRPASDQYSLGIVVYEWLTGDRPFHGSFTEIAVKHSVVPPPSLREKVPAIPNDVEQVVMTALAKEPKERFGSVQTFATALEQASPKKKLYPSTYPYVTIPVNQSQQSVIVPLSPSSSLQFVDKDKSNTRNGLEHFTNKTSQLFDSVQWSKSIFSGPLLILSLLLFGALTLWHTLPILGPLDGFFLTFFGWFAYLLILGMIAFSFAHFVEGTRKTHFIRWPLVVGLLVLLLLVLAESRLLLGSHTGGVIGSLLVYPLLGWPALIQHILVLGACALVTIVTIRSTFRRQR